MTLKKKVLASTLAAGLAVSSFAGLPLSSKGVLERLGLDVQVASAATYTDVLNQLNGVHGELSDDDKLLLSDVKQQVLDLNNATLEADPAFAAIIAKIDALNQQQQTPFSNVTAIDLVNFFKAAASLTYDPQGSNVKAFALNQTNRDVVDSLVKLGGQQDLETALSYNEVADFIDKVRTELVAGFGNLTISEATAIFVQADSTAVLEYIKKAVKKVIDDNAQSPLSLIWSNLNITGAEITAVMQSVYSALSDQAQANKALLTLAAAYVRTVVSINSPTSPATEFTPTLTMHSQPIPNGLLDWSSNNNFITFASGKFTLSTSAPNNADHTATITAKLSGKDVEVYKGTITLRRNFTGGGGGGYFPPVAPPTAWVDPTIATELLNEATAAVQALLASPDASLAELEQARALVAKALQAAAVVNIPTKVENGVTVPDFTLARLIEEFNRVKEIAEQFNAKLAELDPTADPVKVVATINFGTLNSAALELVLTDDIVAAAKTAGIEAIGIQGGGFAIVIDLQDVTSETKVKLTFYADSTVTDVTTNRLVSDVVGIDIEANGQVLDEFGAQIQMKFQLSNLTGVDTELLSLARFAGNLIHYFGGKFDAGAGELSVFRRHLSTYAVVENKVDFDDIQSVRAWAGRQIDVVAAKGIIEGRGEDKYDPAAPVTRAEFTKMIVRVFGLDGISDTEHFDDVHVDDWFRTYVAAAVQIGLVNGRTLTTFEPNATITRAEMATIVSRALAYALQYRSIEDIQSSLQQFVDSGEIHPTLQAGVALASEHGIIIGQGDGVFNPNANATRAEGAVVVYRLISKLQ